MCHNSGDDNEQQIERFMAFGMPKKAVKSVKYTLRKREKQQQRHQQQQQQRLLQLSGSGANSSASGSSSSSSCASSSGDEAATDDEKSQLDTMKTALDVVVAANCDSDSSSGIDVEQVKQPSKIPYTAAAEAAAAATPTVANHNNNNSSALNARSLLQIKFCPYFRKQQEQQRLQQQQQQAQAEATTATVAAVTNTTATVATATTTTTTTVATTKISSAAAEEASKPQTVDKLRNMEPTMEDTLAIIVQMTRLVSLFIDRIKTQLQESYFYTIMTSTTQPAHLVVVVVLALVLMIVGPRLMVSNISPAMKPGTSEATDEAWIPDKSQSCAGGCFATFVYMLAFATHFGSQIWMTFVSGLALYFTLPRHIFGQCQQILFPTYFTMNSLLSITMLIIYVKYLLETWTTASSVHVGALTMNSVIEVVVRVYFAPPMLILMREKYKIEDAIGSGQEVGNLVQGDLTECPHYQRIHKSFRRKHLTCAIGNMVVLAATCLQCYFLASKIRIS